MSDREISYAEAIREALAEEMARDERVFLVGEDIGVYGGTFKVEVGLYERFGAERVRDTPIAECGIVGTAVGAAMTGMRPVAVLPFMDHIPIAIDQLVNQAAKIRYMTGGQCTVPLTVRAGIGGGRSGAAQHSQSLHAWCAHIPGVYVVLPATPADAKGLLKAAIRDDNVVVFCEHKLLYSTKGPVPEGEYVIPLGQAVVRREGSDATIVAFSIMLHRALEAAEMLAKEGVEVEVIDPRTLHPLDVATIVRSVRKTKHAVVVDESNERCGATAEVAAVLAKEAFDFLDAPIERIGTRDAPIPFSKPLEAEVIPQSQRIAEHVRQLLNR